MDFKKILKPLGAFALSIAAFASCAVAVKNPTLQADAFEYSTSASVTYHFSSTNNVTSVFTLQEEYEDLPDYGYLKLTSTLPNPISSVGFAFNGYTTTCIGTASGGDFRLYSGRLDNVPFVSLDILNSSGGTRDLLSLVVVDSSGVNIVYVSDPESWKQEYGAAAVYQWSSSETPYIYLVRAKDFVSFESFLNSITYERTWHAPNGADFYLYGSLNLERQDWVDSASIAYDISYPYLNLYKANSGFVNLSDDYESSSYRMRIGVPDVFRRTMRGYLYGYDGISGFTLLGSGYPGINPPNAFWIDFPYGSEFFAYSSYRLDLYCDPIDLNTLSSGYSQGYRNGYDDGYDYGYDEGESVGNAEGYSEGYIDGVSSGYSQGYGDGYAVGFHDGDISAQGISWNFFSMLSMVFSAPFTIIVNSFDFTFFEGTPNAFNFGTFFWGMFSLLLAFAIFKIVWGFITSGK